ncbi:MAG: D-alanyl-D-alanine carboxypeptidase [Oscillospiraceae bacterium]|nr:D-alanyl-D-alanine carboxypeptidase [Oscillospiraceae bacterium]
MAKTVKKRGRLKKEYIYRRRRAVAALVLTIVIFGIIISAVSCSAIKKNKQDDTPVNLPVNTDTPIQTPTEPEIELFEVDFSKSPSNFTKEDVNSKYAILIDAETGVVISHRSGNAKIYPASMAKVMTILVAVENIKDFNATYEMTYEIIKPLVDADATRAGFKEGEDVKIIDLLYGLILPSGGDCAIALAEYISGSEEEFVKLMNAKCEELGLQNTHFSNTSGLHDENNYSTPADMAIIMKYAMENPICREVLSTYKYTTEKTEENPEGIELFSTMFSRMYGNEVEGVDIVAGKTGYTTEAGNCLVSYATKDEKSYICVLADGESKWKSIYDTFAVYEKYIPENVSTDISVNDEGSDEISEE